MLNRIAFVTAIAFAAGLLVSGTARAAVVLSADVAERGVADTEPGFDTLDLNDGGFPNASKAFAGGINVDINPVGFAFGDNDRHRTTPAGGGTLPQTAILRDFIFAPTDTTGLDTTVSGLNPNTFYDVTIHSFDTGSPGVRVSDWSVSGTGAATVYTFDRNADINNDGDGRFVLTGRSDAGGNLVVSGRGNANTTGTSPAVFLNGLQLNELPGEPAPQLKVDFGNIVGTGGGPGGVQDGFYALEGAETLSTAPVSGSFYSTAGIGDTVNVSIAGYTHFRDYAAIGALNPAGNQNALLSDMVLRNSNGTMTLTLDNLEPGDYSLKMYHHSTQFGGLVFDLQLTDANGTSLLSGIPVTDGTNPASISTSMLNFTSNGSPVTVDFFGGTGPEHVSLNGFEVTQRPTVPEPATALMGLLGIFALAARTRRRQA